jgi:hypothetical protein
MTSSSLKITMAFRIYYRKGFIGAFGLDSGSDTNFHSQIGFGLGLGI